MSNQALSSGSLPARLRSMVDPSSCAVGYPAPTPAGTGYAPSAANTTDVAKYNAPATSLARYIGRQKPAPQGCHKLPCARKQADLVPAADNYE